MKIKHKLFVGFFVCALVAGVAAIVGIIGLNQVRDNLEKTTSQITQRIDEQLDLNTTETELGRLTTLIENAETTEQVLEYMIERFRAWYEDEQIPVEVFKAVSAKGLSQPLDIQRRVHAVHAFSELPEASALAAANKRVANILAKLDRAHEFGEVNTDLLQETQEIALADRLATVKSSSATLFEEGDYTAALAELAALMPEKVIPDTSTLLLCPMPGLIVSVAVEEGEEVFAGQTLAVVEAMKMENILRAEQDAVIAKVLAAPGDSFAVDQVILEFEES